jgi:hypothetical protein
MQMKIYEMTGEIEDLNELISDAMTDLITERGLSEKLYEQYSKSIHDRQNTNVKQEMAVSHIEMKNKLVMLKNLNFS